MTERTISYSAQEDRWHVFAPGVDVPVLRATSESSALTAAAIAVRCSGGGRVLVKHAGQVTAIHTLPATARRAVIR
jgi:hypothetical protein